MGVLAGYVVINAVAWWRNPPMEFGDTYRYFGSVLFDVLNPGITTTFVYTTLQSPTLVTGFQVGLFTISWLLLAWLVFRALAPHWIGYALPAILLVVSLTPTIWSWNVLLGSESFAISAGVLWLASMVWVARRPEALVGALWWNAGAAAFFMITRPQVVLVVAPVQVLWTIWGVQRSGRTWRAAAPLLLVVSASTFAMVRLLSLASDPLYRFRYSIHQIVDKPTSFQAYVLERTDCAPMREALSGGAPWIDMSLLSQSMINECPETYLFLRSDQTSLITWSLNKPMEALQQFFDVMQQIVIPIYTPGRALPEVADGWLLPQWPVWILIAISLVLGLVAARIVGVRMRWNWSVVGSVALLALVSAGFAYAVWASDGIEHDRHLMPLTILAVVAALIFPAVLGKGSTDSVDDTVSELAPSRY